MDSLTGDFNQFSLLDFDANNQPTINGDSRAQSQSSKTRANNRICPSLKSSESFYDFYICVDFECTCDSNNSYWDHEIIEIPAVIVAACSLEIVGEFRTFVRPSWETKLTKFCTKLTGIHQEDVDSAPLIDEAIQLLMKYLGVNNFLLNGLFVFDGDWDVNSFLIPELTDKKIPVPAKFLQFCNIRKVFDSHFGRAPRRSNVKRDIEFMIKKLSGQTFVGRKHSGIDDARNLARVLIQLIHKGAGKNVSKFISTVTEPPMSQSL